MLVIIFYIILACLLSLASNVCGGFAESSYPRCNNITFPYPTLGPININPHQVEKKSLSPLILTFTSTETGLLENNGLSVRIHFNHSQVPGTAIGGPLNNSSYILNEFRFWWNNHPEGISTVTFNGKGSPVTATFYFYNNLYGNFKDALNYRNGIALIAFMVDLCCDQGNEKFNLLAPYLRKVKKTGTSTSIPNLKYIQYLLINSSQHVNEPYYVYPGDYIEVENNFKIHQCSIIIITPGKVCISQEQYEDTFLLFQNDEGQPLLTNTTIYPIGKRPLLKSTKFCTKVTNCAISVKKGPRRESAFCSRDHSLNCTCKNVHS